MKPLKTLIATLGLVAAFALVAPTAAQSAPPRADDATAGSSALPVTTAADPCTATWVCLYASTGFVNMRFRTQRQNWCWLLSDFNLTGVYSYDNRLPVYGHFFNSAKVHVWEIRNGGSSSDSSSFPGEYYFCTGSARP
ncbi:hypothetical protein [Saccharothrix longispora]|uniref:hypothetical protein n=1 Tax=Saccharothrix longispora TaxID=33920 RepID=UPI0028FDA661|nr:hypothetical protein [Saccharothrix longispora]MDU0287902.1 hypothetical protein [Saccharothrix longispora]